MGRLRRKPGFPLETAVERLRNMRTSMSYAALSLGWWLPGNQVMDPVGSPRATDPSSVGSQPSCAPSASVTGCGEPA
ncbi:hypothetical protein SCALM49S_01841 [Streptomyces californicus]